VPVLAGSAAYAVAETFGWQGTLRARLDKGEGRGFYAMLAVATLGGVGLCFTPMDPVRELFWAAVVNGVIAVPIMVVVMLLASSRRLMGAWVIGGCLRALGWLATLAMAGVVVALFAAL
jgi:Mn2+/Fe2+ NRAMP family transporter